MERLILVAYVVLLVVQVFAYFAGAHAWFGWPWYIALFALLAAAFLVRDLAGLAMAVIAFYGIWRGWEWPFWAAVIIAFPFLILTLVGLAGGGIAKMADRNRHAW